MDEWIFLRVLTIQIYFLQKGVLFKLHFLWKVFLIAKYVINLILQFNVKF